MKRLASLVVFLPAVAFVAALIIGGIKVQTRDAEAGYTNPGVTGTLAPGQVPYTAIAHTSTPGVVAGSDNLFWDNTNARLGIGTAAPGFTLFVQNNIAGTDVATLKNTNASGLSGIRFEPAASSSGFSVGFNSATDKGYFHRAFNKAWAFGYDDDNNPATPDISDAQWNADRSFTFNTAVNLAGGTTITGTSAATSFVAGNQTLSTTGVSTASGQDFVLTEASGSDYFYYRGSTDRVGIGSGIVTAQMAYPVNIIANSTSTAMQVRNINNGGLSGIRFGDDADVSQGFIFYSNTGNVNDTGQFAIRVGSGKTFVLENNGTVTGLSMSSTGGLGLRGISDDTQVGTAATTDATVTTCGSFTPTASREVSVTANVVARQGTTAGAGYVLAATFRLNGTTVTQIGTTTALATHEDVAGWDATINTDGAVIRVRVTGAAATNANWDCRMQVRYVA